ncbi:MAG: hypothetical protein ACI3XJ_12285, partial [Oscillospiraceae bacterium]
TKTLAAGKSKLDDKTTYNLATDETLLGENITFWAYGLKGTKTAVTAPESLATVTDWSNTDLSDAQVKKIKAATTDATEIFFNYDPAKTYISGKGIMVKAIDNDGDGKYEYILNEKETFAEVQYVSTSGVITLNKVDTGDNEQVAYDGIAAGDKVLVISYDGNSYIEKAAYVTGYISGYSMSTTVKTATIGGEKYEVSGIDYKVVNGKTTQFTKVIDTYFATYNGTTYNYFQDEYGNIIAYAKADELDTEYALILDFDTYTTGPWAKELWVKYLTTDGEVVTDIVNEDVSWNFSTKHDRGDVVKYRLDEDGEFVVVYTEDNSSLNKGWGYDVYVDAATDRATISSDRTIDANDDIYNVNDSFVAFFYISGSYQGERASMSYDRDYNAYYGVLTGADAIAELDKEWSDLHQYDATATGTSHTEKYGTLKMVNLNDYIDPTFEYCYITDVEAFDSETTKEEGDVYFYQAVNAAGEDIVVALTAPLNPKTAKNVGAYYTLTLNLVKGGTITVNWFENVSNVKFGDLHATDDNTVFVYEWDDQEGVELPTSAAVVNVSGKGDVLTALSEDFCATGYVVTGNVKGKTGAVAIFVTELPDGDVDYIDVKSVMIRGVTESGLHLYVGSTIDVQEDYYTVKVGTADPIDLGKTDSVKVTAAWAGKDVVISAYVPDTNDAIDRLDEVRLNGEKLDTAKGYDKLDDAIANATKINLAAVADSYKLVVTTKVSNNAPELTWGDVDWASTVTAAKTLTFGPYAAISGTEINLTGINTGSYIVIALENTGDVAYFAYVIG